MIGHVAPEAARGGPLAIVQEGDEIEINLDERRVDLLLSEEEIADRLLAWQPPAPRYEWGAMARYSALVSSASEGAVLVMP